MTLAQIFVQVFWMSVAATIVAVPVMVLLGLFSHWKVPKWASCLLYALVLFRMVCPLALPGDWGLFSIPWIQGVQQGAVELFDGYAGEYEVAVEGSETYEQAVAAGLTPERIVKDSPQSMLYVPYRTDAAGAFAPAQTAMETWVPWVARVWLVGVVVFYGLTILSYVLLRRRLRFAVKEEEDVYVSDRISSPCAVGYFRPRIYLVPGLSAEERAHILAHERAHLRAGDQWAKLIAWLALGIHWFNVSLWMVYRVYCGDLEQACDERVVRAADVEARKAYSRTLLNLSYDRRFRWLNPVAFAEGGTKERVEHILHLKQAKPALLVLAAVAAITVVVLCISGGAPQHGEKTTPTVIDHTGLLTPKQIAALEDREGASITMDPDIEWINTQGFSALEILSVETQGERYTMEVLEGTVLFGWLGHVEGYPDGVSVACFGVPLAYCATYLWDGTDFILQDHRQAGELLQSGMEELDVSGFSGAAKQRMADTGAGLATLSETLCRQAEAWYGGEAFSRDCFVDGRIGSLFISDDGRWVFNAYEEGAPETETEMHEGTFADLRGAGQLPAGTDISGWSDEQLVWALSTAEGGFRQELAAALEQRLADDAEAVLKEITALGAQGRSKVCWALAEANAEQTAEQTKKRISSLQGLVPAQRATAQLLSEDAERIWAGETEPPVQEFEAGTWAVQGPITTGA